MLNLQKNDVLDLTKKNPGLKNVQLGAGWDVAKKGFFSFQADYDLDLVALLIDRRGRVSGKHSLVYYGNQREAGIYLHGDNRTGAGEGDDEKISVSLNKIPSECSKVVFAVTIYQAKTRNQNFGKVRNAYVRLTDDDKNGSEICRYNLTDDGGENTAIVFAELVRDGAEWQFKAVGKLLDASVSSLYESYK
ncbi:MAG: TerD family protein [Sarcina sp.]